MGAQQARVCVVYRSSTVTMREAHPWRVCCLHGVTTARVGRSGHVVFVTHAIPVRQNWCGIQSCVRWCVCIILHAAHG